MQRLGSTAFFHFSLFFFSKFKFFPNFQRLIFCVSFLFYFFKCFARGGKIVKAMKFLRVFIIVCVLFFFKVLLFWSLNNLYRANKIKQFDAKKFVFVFGRTNQTKSSFKLRKGGRTKYLSFLFFFFIQEGIINQSSFSFSSKLEIK